MLILEPLSQFLIEFFRNNPSDTNTYYIQSVVYDSISGNVLATVNLANQGNGYFSKLWALPADTYGNGRQITIISTCYNDSGHSQISTIYGATLEKYIVRHLASQNLGGFTAQIGETVRRNAPDYAKIREIVREIVQQEKPAGYDDSKLNGRLDEIESTISERAEQHESSLKKSEENLKSEIASRSDETGRRAEEAVRHGIDPVMPKFDEIGESLEQARSENSALHKQTHRNLESLGSDTSVKDTLAEMDRKAEDRHIELKDAQDAPINLVFQGAQKTKFKQEAKTQVSPEEERAASVAKMASIARK